MTQTSTSELQLYEILKRRGLLSNISMKCVQGFMEKWRVDAYRSVVETHCVEESRLAEILAEEFHLKRIYNLRSQKVERKALETISYENAMRLDAFPMFFNESGALQIAISDPTRLERVKRLNLEESTPVVYVVAERSEVEVSIQRHYPLSMQLPKTMKDFAEGLSK